MKQQKQSKTRTTARRKGRAKGDSKKAIERKYQQTFTPHSLPYHGLYTDEDSLEQPSELEYVPTTSTPYIEA